MKYIRTKDGIYRVLQYGSVKKHYVIVAIGLGHKVIDTSEIIKQADTIEKLCDEFVIDGNVHIRLGLKKFPFVREYMGFSTAKQDKKNFENCDLFGAIWTPKGLVYVAKMSEKGELELL